MTTRADRIYEIVLAHSGRMSIKQIMQTLKKSDAERNLKLTYDAVGATIRMDNKTRNVQGKVTRFITAADGVEERGYVSLNKTVKASNKKAEILADSASQIPSLIAERNLKTKEELRERIKALSWEVFEDSFIESFLEAIGFKNIEITKKTHDGGKDALANYQRGLVKSKILISAKHWNSNTVGISEIQRVRGIKADADTAVIITSSRFSKDALAEAENVQNQRAVVLIDMNYLVDICFENNICVKNVELPELFIIHESFISNIEETKEKNTRGATA